MPEVIVTALAEADIDDIFSDLEDRKIGAGKEWFVALHQRLNQLRMFPELGASWRGPFGRLVFRRKYGVIYQSLPLRIVIVAIYSLHRSPEMIWARLRRFVD